MTSRMPVLFVGHGSPMNAIETNSYTQALAQLGRDLPKPEAVLCVSAHWMSEGTWITHMSAPKTIHDFYGFPQALFDVQYPAPGAPKIAEKIRSMVLDPQIHLDDEMWGFDHGSWAVLKHIYPKADVPLLQLSLYIEQPAEYHFKLGQALGKLRDEGILIIGSGNIVHNLRQIKWDKDAKPFDWAHTFDQWTKQKIEARDFKALVHEATLSEEGKLSIPTPEHWYPLLYTLGASDKNDAMSFVFEQMQNASISMRSVRFG